MPLFPLFNMIWNSNTDPVLIKGGEESQWLVANKARFKELTDKGDEDFIDLPKELDGQ